MSRFKIGDVVLLNSGGPPMTVTGITSDGLVDVAWFDGDRVRRDIFAPFALLTEAESMAKMRQAADEFIAGLRPSDGYDA